MQVDFAQISTCQRLIGILKGKFSCKSFSSFDFRSFGLMANVVQENGLQLISKDFGLKYDYDFNIKSYSLSLFGMSQFKFLFFPLLSFSISSWVELNF